MKIQRQAFTLIELLVVIGVIMLLLGMGIPAISAMSRRADLYNTINVISNIHTNVYQVARTETGDRHLRYGYSLSALGVKPFFQAWQQFGGGYSQSVGNPQQAYSLNSNEYDRYVFPITQTKGVNLVGKTYAWRFQEPAATDKREEVIPFEDTGSLSVAEGRVGNFPALSLNTPRGNTGGLIAHNMQYTPSEGGSGFQSAPSGIASLNITFEPGTGFIETAIGISETVASGARGTCADIFLTRANTNHARYRMYFFPSGQIQVVTASD